MLPGALSQPQGREGLPEEMRHDPPETSLVLLLSLQRELYTLLSLFFSHLFKPLESDSVSSIPQKLLQKNHPWLWAFKNLVPDA